MNELPLEKLLQYCSDRSNKMWQSAWKEFHRRYNDFIYRAVVKRCRSWKAARLKDQFSESVNDIVGDVYKILITKLHTFKDSRNKKVFEIWLTQICNRSASYFLRRKFVNVLVAEPAATFMHYVKGVNPFNKLEFYEDLISFLRERKTSRQRLLERDLHIFFLYVWADLPKEIVLRHPCFSDVGERVVYVVVDRLRSTLKKEKDLFLS